MIFFQILVFSLFYMMKKILWFDVETTGVDSDRHGIIQFAAIVEIDGELVDTLEIKMQPHQGALISEDALVVNGVSREEIQGFMPHDEAYGKIDSFLAQYVSRFDRKDKFYPAGYNVQFDLDFLNKMFRRYDQYGIGSFVNWKRIDLLPLLYYMDYLDKIALENYKLQTVCAHFGVELNSAHDAMSDVKATREVMRCIEGYM
jgi:DNA polymerase-3 subunit epsilon